MVDVAGARHTEGQEGAGSIPDLRGDIRPLIPKLGLRNYWYPAIAKRKIPTRRPIKVRVMGEDLCFFKGDRGQAAAIRDICPHRGASISEGTCHYKGTVSCSYHGWTFNEQGKNVAVLSEGPESKICGLPGTEAKLYPTRDLKGIVFVWMGDQAPAPIEEDVPEEFFDPDAYILYNERVHWDTNWAISLENYFDAHFCYLHRDDIQSLLGSPRHSFRATTENVAPAFTGNGFTYASPQTEPGPAQDVHPNGWKWPKHRFRRFWAWAFVPFFSLTRVPAPVPKNAQSWGSDMRLPGMVRVPGAFIVDKLRPPQRRFRYGGAGVVGRMTRWPVAIEEDRCRMWYFHYTRPRTWLHRLWHKFLYLSLYKWVVEYNFSAQDGSVMPNQRWDTPEMLAPTDFGVVQWRKLVVIKHFGGRDAPFR